MAGSDGNTGTAPWLVGDFGATNLRFALAHRSGSGFVLDRTHRLAVADHDGPEPAIARYLRSIAPLRPEAAALAIAGPVEGDTVEMTNTGWRWSNEALRRRFDLARVVALNDAEAQARALPYLAGDDLRPVGPDRPQPATGMPRVLIAPGSGLGVSALVGIDGRAHAIAGEGGHATMAPETDLERAVHAMLARDHGRVSWERVLSGPGIEAIFRTCERENGRAPSGADAATVAARAADGDPVAREAIAAFGALLGAYAGDLALIFGARGGVFIGGGIAPSIADAIEAGPFRLRFESKGRFRDYLRAIPTAIVMHPYPGLIGAATRLETLKGNRE